MYNLTNSQTVPLNEYEPEAKSVPRRAPAGSNFALLACAIK